ncbi:hypothetical protein GON09_005255 [Rhodococcus sp. B50]|nr:hypothetical protein [Rhodococcus sp. B50]
MRMSRSRRAAVAARGSPTKPASSRTSASWRDEAGTTRPTGGETVQDLKEVVAAEGNADHLAQGIRERDRAVAVAAFARCETGAPPDETVKSDRRDATGCRSRCSRRAFVERGKRSRRELPDRVAVETTHRNRANLLRSSLRLTRHTRFVRFDENLKCEYVCRGTRQRLHSDRPLDRAAPPSHWRDHCSPQRRVDAWPPHPLSAEPSRCADALRMSNQSSGSRNSLQGRRSRAQINATSKNFS